MAPRRRTEHFIDPAALAEDPAFSGSYVPVGGAATGRDAQFPSTRTVNHLDSYIAFENTEYVADNGSRVYIVPGGAGDDHVISGVGGVLKIFADRYQDGDVTDYRDFGLYFHANQNGDDGVHGNGVFWLNSKATGTYASSGFPDIGFSFNDSEVAARISRLTNLSLTRGVLVVGSADPDIASKTNVIRMEVQGDLGFGGADRGIRWLDGSSNATNLLRLATTNATITLGGTQQLRVTNTGALIQGSAALGTTTTDGFFYQRAMAGTPTGTPTANTGTVPTVFDTSGSKLWAYIGGAWKSVTLA